MPGTNADGRDGWLGDPRSPRVVNAFAIEFVVGYMARAAALFDHDYDCAMIFLALLQASGRQAFRDPLFRAKYSELGSSLPVELSTPVSRQAVARTVGLSRETVRRKVAKLIAQGFLTEDARGGVILTRGVTSNPAFIQGQKEGVDLVRRFLADLSAFAKPLGSAEQSDD